MPPPAKLKQLPNYLNYTIAKSFKGLAQTMIGSTIVVTVLLIVGYLTNNLNFVAYFGPAPFTAPNIALMVLILALVLFIDHTKWNFRFRWLQHSLLSLVAVYSLVTIIFIIANVSPTWVETLLWDTYFSEFSSATVPNRPPVEIAIALLLLACTIFAGHAQKSPRPYIFLSLTSIAITATTLVGKLLSFPTHTSAPAVQAAATTPYSSLLLQSLLLLGVIFTFPTKGILRFLITPTPISQITQRILFLCVIIPIASLAATISLYYFPQSHTGVSVLVMSQVLVFSLFIYLLFNALERLESDRLTSLELASRSTQSIDDHAPLVELLRQELTPQISPEYKGLNTYTHNRPASGHLSGDWLTVSPLSDTVKCFILIDVSGHGAEAALFALRIKYALLVALRHGKSPAEALADTLPAFEDQPDRLTTAVVAKLDMDAKVCTYANAGHLPVFRLSRKSITKFAQTSPALGIPDCEPQNITFGLAGDDLIIFYTDGLVEARAPSGEFFGIERLQKICEDHAAEGPRSIVENSMSQAWEFSHQNLNDDATIAIIQIKV